MSCTDHSGMKLPAQHRARRLRPPPTEPARCGDITMLSKPVTSRTGRRHHGSRAATRESMFAVKSFRTAADDSSLSKNPFLRSLHDSADMQAYRTLYDNPPIRCSRLRIQTLQKQGCCIGSWHLQGICTSNPRLPGLQAPSWNMNSNLS